MNIQMGFVIQILLPVITVLKLALHLRLLFFKMESIRVAGRIDDIYFQKAKSAADVRFVSTFVNLF